MLLFRLLRRPFLYPNIEHIHNPAGIALSDRIVQGGIVIDPHRQAAARPRLHGQAGPVLLMDKDMALFLNNMCNYLR